MSKGKVEIGQPWDHETQGLCVIVRRSEASASVGYDVWETYRVRDGAPIYMWDSARTDGEWMRRAQVNA